MEYSSHLWDGSTKKYQLKALEKVDKRARKLIGDNGLFGKRLLSLKHPCKVNS